MKQAMNGMKCTISSEINTPWFYRANSFPYLPSIPSIPSLFSIPSLPSIPSIPSLPFFPFPPLLSLPSLLSSEGLIDLTGATIRDNGAGYGKHGNKKINNMRELSIQVSSLRCIIL